MDERKKSPIEKEKYDEVKNRADGRTNERTDERKKKIHQSISKSPMAIYNNRMAERKKSPIVPEVNNRMET